MAVWIAAVFAYVVAVAHRSSFGVAGLDAVDRFQVDATTLSLFAVVQLGVYAAAQLPVGMALDQFGPRKVMTIGAILMAIGQLGMALSPTVGLAIGMRVLVGIGDATTFVGAVRLLPAWFPERRVPLLTQITGIVGQLGQVISAVPFVALLHHAGWPPAFTILAGLGAVAAVTTWLIVRDAPRHAPGDTASREPGDAPPTPTVTDPNRSPGTTKVSSPTLREVFAHPGSWLGFWTHMVTSFSLNAFALMWGYPFLVSGQGLTPAQASGLLTINVFVAILAGPIIGEFTARHPLRRSWAVIAIAIAVGVAWALVIVPSTPRPMWVLVLFISLLAVGGPGSAIGFDYARSFTAPARLGAATGLVNVGGFAGSMVAVLGIGVVMDLGHSGTSYTLDDFRRGFLVIAAMWAIGVIGLLMSRARTRAVMAERGVAIPPLAEAWVRWRRR